MKKLNLLSGILLILCFTACKQGAPVTTVKIDGGMVEGVVKDSITIFKGIPFAAPPVGDLRWKAPQPVVKWDGVLKADKYAPACPQMSYSRENIGDLRGLPLPQCMDTGQVLKRKTARDGLDLWRRICDGSHFSTVVQRGTTCEKGSDNGQHCLSCRTPWFYGAS